MPTLGKINNSLNVKVGDNYNDHCTLTFESAVITIVNSLDADRFIKYTPPTPCPVTRMAYTVGKSMIWCFM
jgi:hypothetical protein